MNVFTFFAAAGVVTLLFGLTGIGLKFLVPPQEPLTPWQRAGIERQKAAQRFAEPLLIVGAVLAAIGVGGAVLNHLLTA